jgi:hypothetical protein
MSVLKHTVVLLFVLVSIAAWSQSRAPEIRNLRAEVDTAAGKIFITYDLIDPDSREVEVYLRASGDHGKSWLLYTHDAVGDLGLLVRPGKNKEIVWNYNKRAGNVFDFQIKLVAEDRSGSGFRSVVDRADNGRLVHDVNTLEGTRHYLKGAPGLEIAKNLLYNRFYELGLDSRKQEFMLGGYRGHNISGRITGHIDEPGTILVVAHYDTHAESSGAGDNASGLAVMLETARILANQHFRKSIVFVGVDLQKQGGIGVKRYLQQLSTHQINKISSVYVLDNVGIFTDTPVSQELTKGQERMFNRLTMALDKNSWRGDFLFALADAQSVPVRSNFAEMASAYAPKLKVHELKTAGKGSEEILFGNGVYAPFWERNIPTVFLSDGAETRNKNFDTSKDLAEHLNFAAMEDVTRALAASIAHDAQMMHGDVKTTTVLKKEPVREIVETNSHLVDYQLYLTDENQTLKVRINHPTNGKLLLRLLDTKGEVYYKSNIDLYYESVISINTSYLEEGVYLVNLSSSHFDELKEFIIP